MLIEIQITRDVNEYGEMAYLVTAFYRRHGIRISVPDTKGWPTLDEAREHAEQIRWNV